MSVAPVEIVELSPSRRAHRSRFIGMPATLYRGDPRYVPPLRREVHSLLDPSRNPWHRHAELALFLAVRAGVTVGRIAAVRDRRHDGAHAEPVGAFGFFDCVDDPECASALLVRAERWVHARGATAIHGPISPSMHDECGCLVDGFDARPVIQMPYNPPHHARLLEAAGYSKTRDLFAYEFLASQDVRPAIARVADAVEAGGDYRLRGVDGRWFAQEAQTLRALFNATWSSNWGFVPLDADEIEWRAGRLRPLIDPRIALIVETRRGEAFETVAFALAVPDVNEILARLNGRLTPLAVLRLARGLRRVSTMRLVLLGVAAPYRRRGLEALLIREIHRRGALAGFARAELSWVLEDNAVMNRTIVKAGGRHYKTYRIYGKRLG
jgi:hypothetical protein